MSFNRFNEFYCKRIWTYRDLKQKLPPYKSLRKFFIIQLIVFIKKAPKKNLGAFFGGEQGIRTLEPF